MARFLRILLQKIPPVRRQLSRITDIEVALQAQALVVAELERRTQAQAADMSRTSHAANLRFAEIDAPARARVSVVAAQEKALESGAANLADTERQALLDEIAKRDREIRILKVNYGATFDELVAAGKAGGGTVYSFDELLAIQAKKIAAPTAPPLVFLHVPKAGGTTLNNILMKNYRFRIDSYGDAFFPRYYPDEFVSLVGRPEADDTRRPVYFTGHIDVDNDIFRYMPVRYVAMTMLRDPVQRMVSHYRFHSSLNGSPLAAEINHGALSFADYVARFRGSIPLQYDVFAPQKSGDEAARVQEALRALDSKVSVFGLQEDYDAFVVMLQDLLGLPDVFYVPLNRTPKESASVAPGEADQVRDLLRHDIDFYEGAKAIYQRRKDVLGADFDARVAAFAGAKKDYLDLIGGRREDGHGWRGAYAGLTPGKAKD